MLLQEGNWSEYPCDDRMLRVYISTIVFILVIVGFLYGVVRVGEAIRFSFQSQPEPEIRIFSNDRISLIAVGLVGLFFLLIMAIVPALGRSMTSLVATESSIVETGCRLRTSYTEIWDRSKTDIYYRYSRGKNNFDELYFVQKGKRRLRLRINNPGPLSNLIAIAPDAMQDYADQLRSEGKKLSAELERL
jgi:hypothetical protein